MAGALIRQSKPKRLVVLDVNGVLCVRSHQVYGRVKNPLRSPDFTSSRGWNVWLRPGAVEFVDYVMSRFDVAVWSSMVKHNLDEVVDFVFKERKERLVFVWDQTACTSPSGASMPGTPGKPVCFKDLKTVWNRFGDKYRVEETLLIDDSEHKMQLNLVEGFHDNCLLIDSFTVDHVAENHDTALSKLKAWMEGLVASKLAFTTYKQRSPYSQPIPRLFEDDLVWKMLVDACACLQL